MFSIKLRWIKFADDTAHLTELLRGRACAPISVNGKSLLLVYHQDEFHLVKNRCPHQGITLENASCSNGFIVCPWHH